MLYWEYVEREEEVFLRADRIQRFESIDGNELRETIQQIECDDLKSFLVKENHNIKENPLKSFMLKSVKKSEYLEVLFNK